MLPLTIVKIHLNIGRVILPIPVNIQLPVKRWSWTGSFTIDLMEAIENHLKFSDGPTDDLRGLEAFRDVIVKDKGVKVTFNYGVERDPLEVYSAYKAEVETDCDTVKVCLEGLLSFGARRGGMVIVEDSMPPVAYAEERITADVNTSSPKKFTPAASSECHKPMDK